MTDSQPENENLSKISVEGDLSQLAELLSAVVSSAESAREAVVSEQQARRVDRRLIIGLTTVAILLAAVSLVLLVQSRDRGIQNRAIFSRVVDCTTPDSDCYKRSQANTAEAVSSLMVINLAGQECRYATTDSEGFEACVIKSVPVRMRPLAKDILAQVDVKG